MKNTKLKGPLPFILWGSSKLQDTELEPQKNTIYLVFFRTNKRQIENFDLENDQNEKLHFFILPLFFTLCSSIHHGMKAQYFSFFLKLW